MVIVLYCLPPVPFPSTMQTNSRDRILTQLRFVVLAKLIWIRWEWDTAWPHSRPLRHEISKIPKIPCNSFWVLLLALSSLQLRSTIRMDKQARGTHNMITLILLFVVELRDIRCVCVCGACVYVRSPHSFDTDSSIFSFLFMERDWNVVDWIGVFICYLWHQVFRFGCCFSSYAVYCVCVFVNWLVTQRNESDCYILGFVGFCRFF